MEHGVVTLLKVVVGIFVAGGMASALAAGVSTYWLLWETANDERAKRFTFRMHGVPAAALRGEWPNLASARWYRRLVRLLLACWIYAAIGAIAYEIARALQ